METADASKVKLAHFDAGMHIVPSVQGRLAADHTTCDLMRATFPARPPWQGYCGGWTGTVRGAPMIRVRQIVQRRGIDGYFPPPTMPNR